MRAPDVLPSDVEAFSRKMFVLDVGHENFAVVFVVASARVQNSAGMSVM